MKLAQNLYQQFLITTHNRVLSWLLSTFSSISNIFIWSIGTNKTLHQNCTCHALMKLPAWFLILDYSEIFLGLHRKLQQSVDYCILCYPKFMRIVYIINETLKVYKRMWFDLNIHVLLIENLQLKKISFFVVHLLKQNNIPQHYFWILCRFSLIMYTVSPMAQYLLACMITMCGYRTS